MDNPENYTFPAIYYSVVNKGYLTSMNIDYLLGYCMSCHAKIYSKADKNDKKSYYIYGENRLVKFKEGKKYICGTCIKKFDHCQFCYQVCNSDSLTLGACFYCLSKGSRRFINNYSFKIEEEYSIVGEKDHSAKDGIFYGVELEYEAKDLFVDSAKAFELVKDFASLKKDSSIERGFEIVSAPCSFTRHLNLWDKFFDNLPATINVYRTCGMHVHATRCRLTNLQIGKMLVFLHNPINRKFIEIIAERKSNTQNDYESLKKYSDGKNGGLLPQNADRHTALNLNNYKTIEFRIFNSTKNKSSLIKNIEFCKALIKFTGMGEHSISQAKDYRIFCRYIKKYNKEYTYLFKYLKEKSYI